MNQLRVPAEAMSAQAGPSASREFDYDAEESDETEDDDGPDDAYYE